jgi:hypothetical protein
MKMNGFIGGIFAWSAIVLYSLAMAGGYSGASRSELSAASGLVISDSNNEGNPQRGPAEVMDWSYEMNSPVLSSLRIADMNGDDILEVICTSYGPPDNPYGAGQVAVLDIDGSPLPGWPVVTGAPVPATPAIGDVDSDGDFELVVGDWNRMYVLNDDGSNLPGWPIFNGISYSPALEDLDGDGDLEIIYASGYLLYIRQHDGTPFPNWPVSAPENIGSPSIADIDSDGELEIIAGTLAGPVGPDPYEVYVWDLDGTVAPGFPVSTSGVVKSTPAVGDIDSDGSPEIIAAAYDESNNDFLYCWDVDGNDEPGWPVRVPYCRLSSPALGDVDGDGDLEIFIGGLQTTPEWVEILFAFHHDGQPLENWPVELPHEGAVGNINSSPVIAEVDGDPSSPEIFVKTHDYIFGLNSNGTFLDDFPYYLSDDNNSGTHSPSPAIGDLDYDGDADYIFASSSGTIAFVDADGSFDAELSSWPMYKHDRYGTGRYGFQPRTGIVYDDPLPAEFTLSQNYPNPFNAATTFRYTTEKEMNVTFSIYNLLGQRVATLLDGIQHAGEHSVTWNPSDFPSGVYFARLKTRDNIESIRLLLLK